MKTIAERRQEILDYTDQQYGTRPVVWEFEDQEHFEYPILALIACIQAGDLYEHHRNNRDYTWAEPVDKTLWTNMIKYTIRNWVQLYNVGDLEDFLRSEYKCGKIEKIYQWGLMKNIEEMSAYYMENSFLKMDKKIPWVKMFLETIATLTEATCLIKE